MKSMKYLKGNKHSAGFVDGLRKQTHFSKIEIEKLLNWYMTITSKTGSEDDCLPISKQRPSSNFASHQKRNREGIDRILFREILHNTFRIMSEDVIMDRIFNAFDKRSDGAIQADEWVQGLSIFLKGTLQEQISFTFYVYDLNSDGVISKDEVHALLRNCLLKQTQDEDQDDCVKDLTEVALKKLDIDRDNKISLQDFQKAVETDNLLLEALGQCLPSEDICASYLSNL